MMHRATGRQIDEDDHIRQSVGDILTTPIGSRIMRRTYGSMLPELIDHPATPANRMRLMSATVMAITAWEPRITTTSVAVDLNRNGRVTIEMTAVKRTGQRVGQPLTIVQALK